MSSLLLLLGPHANAQTAIVAAQQGVVSVFVLAVSRFTYQFPRFNFFYWAMWFPILPWTYRNIDYVQRALGGQLHDGLVQQWEQMLFGGSLAQHWCLAWPWPAFSELMHFFYFTYYLVLPVLALRLIFRGEDVRARLTLAGGCATLVTCYLLCGLFPVQGPRPILDPLDPSLHGWFWRATHALCDLNAAAAAAFPSGHVALAAVVLVLGARWDRRLLPFYVIWLLGIWSATVYGRFHYVVDGLAGATLGLLYGFAVREPQSGAPQEPV